jgi:hypothetical protein
MAEMKPMELFVDGMTCKYVPSSIQNLRIKP